MNLPNAISIFRMCLCPVFLYFFLADPVKHPYTYLVAGIVFAVAALSDFLDGYIARAKNIVTNVGKFIDPLADKLIVLAALLGIVQIGWFNSDWIEYADKWGVWIVFIILARELIITAFRAVAAGKNVIMAADIWGKIKTTLQDAAIICMCFEHTFFKTHYSLWLLALSAVFAIVSAVNYMVKNRSVFDTRSK